MAITKLQSLTGHTSQDTAYVVEDYPYGFKLRCKIRYWLEYKPKLGFRFCSQTTNPKHPLNPWNKPNCGTYTLLAVLGLDAKGYVTSIGCSKYQFDELRAFAAVYGESFDETQKAVYESAQAAYDRYQARKAGQ